jgi:hypothetical protein
LLGSQVALPPLLGDRRDDRLVQGFRFSGEVLIPANQLRKAIVSRGKPDRKLVHGGGCRRPGAALNDIERIVQCFFGGQQLLPLRG